MLPDIKAPRILGIGCGTGPATLELAALEQEQQEIDMYRRYSAWYGSAFFVMQCGREKHK